MVIYAAQGWISSFGVEGSNFLIHTIQVSIYVARPCLKSFTERKGATITLVHLQLQTRNPGREALTYRTEPDPFKEDLDTTAIRPPVELGSFIAFLSRSCALCWGSGGLTRDLQVSRSGGIKPRSACRSRALFGFWGIKPRSASQSCAPFGFWGIRPRSARQSGALFGYLGDKAAIFMSVVRSVWVLGIKLRSASQSCASFGFWGIKPRSAKLPAQMYSARAYDTTHQAAALLQRAGRSGHGNTSGGDTRTLLHSSPMDGLKRCDRLRGDGP
ncbi:hypothetical protein B0H14DRAFT_2556705 [Mycena olivaceomarginata]|nr:hypothetical protein B0H14DRAFT_2556705 [Mycena olivaceomarginata]